MTNEEAYTTFKIRCIQCNSVNGRTSCGNCASFNAIEALEKQMPEKPIEVWSKSPFSEDKGCLFEHFMCPKCKYMEVTRINYFCNYCGQAIDWSDDND